MRGFRKGHSWPVPPPFGGSQFFFKKRKKKKGKEGKGEKEKKEKKGIEKMESHACTKKEKSFGLINL